MFFSHLNYHNVIGCAGTCYSRLFSAGPGHRPNAYDWSGTANPNRTECSFSICYKVLSFGPNKKDSNLKIKIRCPNRGRRMIRSLQYVLMTPSTATSLTSASCHLTVLLKSVASSKTVSFSMFSILLLTQESSFCNSRLFRRMQCNFLTAWLDKKNENKEVAVDEFLPSSTAIEAIQHSM